MKPLFDLKLTAEDLKALDKIVDEMRREEDRLNSWLKNPTAESDAISDVIN